MSNIDTLAVTMIVALRRLSVSPPRAWSWGLVCP